MENTILMCKSKGGGVPSSRINNKPNMMNIERNYKTFYI